MDEDNVPVIRSPIKCINLVVDLVCNSIAPLLPPLYPFTVRLVFLLFTRNQILAVLDSLDSPQIDLIGIKESGTPDPQLLPLAHLQVRLVDIVDQGVPPGGALVEVAGLLEGLHDEVEDQREGHLDLHRRVVLNVHPQVLDGHLPYKVSVFVPYLSAQSGSGSSWKRSGYELLSGGSGSAGPLHGTGPPSTDGLTGSR